MKYLPDDILLMICTQLWHQRDFNTLFNCICAGKQLAQVAVTYLYRMQDLTFIPFYDMIFSQRERIKTALWRTIILSSLGKTLYPYSRYIRTLNLRDLELFLLSGSKNTEIFLHGGSENSWEDFFQGELAQFKVLKRAANHRYRQLDAAEIIIRIGEAITKQTPLLEELVAKVDSGALSRWIPRLPRLTHLESWHDRAIEGSGKLIRLHCPLFKGLNVFDWDSGNSDQGLVAFIKDIRPQSLESFQKLDCVNLGLESFQALSCHGESLIELKLKLISSVTIRKLSQLKGCTNLVSLLLAGSELYRTDLEQSYDDAFLETVTWLKECKKLRNLAFAELFSSTALMTPILLENSIHLTSFKFECNIMRDTDSFLQSLANQLSLQRLHLMGRLNDGILAPDILLQSLRNLVDLTHLHLGEISSSFKDEHIMQLARSLPKLEAWSTSVIEPSDEIWSEVASLRSLRRLTISASIFFTANGILDFVEKLGHGNKGLFLYMIEDTPYIRIAPVAQELIQEVIAIKVGGKFKYTLVYDSYTYSDESDFDSDYW